MHCYRCQAELPADATFCSGCGARTTVAPRTIRIAPTTRAVTGPTQRLRLDRTSRLNSDTNSLARPPRPSIVRPRAGRLAAIEELHKQELLTDQEFAVVKATLLGMPSLADSTAPKTDIVEVVDQLAAQQALMALDQEWQVKREQHMSTGKNGKYLPSEGGAIVGGIIFAVMGAVFVIIGLGMASSSGGITIFFAIFGLVFIGMGIHSADNDITKARSYKQAHEAYQKRRAELTAEIEKHKDNGVRQSKSRGV